MKGSKELTGGHCIRGRKYFFPLKDGENSHFSGLKF